MSTITRPHLYCPRLIDHIYQDTNGLYRTCCHGEDIPSSSGLLPFEHYHSDFMYRMRDALIEHNGPVLDEGCYKCAQQERQGIESHRQQSKGKNYNKQMEQIFLTEKIAPNLKSIRLKISPFGNHCNLSCSMCHPMNSHKREHQLQQLPESVRLDWKAVAPQQINVEAIAQDIINHADLIESLDILGGEPIIHKNHNKFMEMLIESGKCQHFKIIYTSNATRLKQKEHILYKIFDYFDSVRIRLSIDDLGKRNEYIRFGSKWSNVDEGINWALEARDKFGIELRVTRTTQFLNVLSSLNVIQYFKSLRIPVDLSESFVYNPWELCVAHAPQKIKDQSDLDYDIIHQPGSIDKFHQGLRYYLALDLIRGTNICEAFPEYEEFVFDIKMDAVFKS